MLSRTNTRPISLHLCHLQENQGPPASPHHQGSRKAGQALQRHHPGVAESWRGVGVGRATGGKPTRKLRASG